MSERNHVKQLLVEGNDDRQVVYHLSNYAEIPRNEFETISLTGYENLIESLEVYVLASEIRQLGIVIDADDDLEAKWASIRRRMEVLGYENLPINPLADGTIVQMENKPTIGIWIMPNNNLTGMLEDFIAFLIPENDLFWEYACQCVNGIDSAQRLFKPSYETKARIHTWLAWQEEPGTPLGYAITKRYLDASRTDAQAFIAWLRRLFAL